MSNQTRLADRLAFIELDGCAAQRLKSMKDVLMAALPGALERFYRKIQAEPTARAFLAKPGVLQRTKGRQRAHWDRIAGGRFDQSYMASVTRVGEAHARVGLEPRWHITGYAILMEQLVTGILAERWPKRVFGRGQGDAADVAADIAALIKAVFLDIDLAVSAYLDAVESGRKAGEAEAEAAAVVVALRPALAALAGGDLTHRIDDAMPDGHQALRQDVNAALDRLQDIMTGIVQNTQGAIGGAEELVQVSDALSRRTEKQAAALRQTAAALNAVTGQTRRTEDLSASARSTLSAARDEAQTASATLHEAAAAIGAIDRSSQDIATVAGQVGEIASRANILALNAGLEAARAGDAGRGFGVIAAEMEALAQRSRLAAQEMKALAAQSGRAVESGLRLVGDGRDALERIAVRAAQANQMAEGIAAAAQQQATGLHQVNKAVARMDFDTQETVTMVERMAAASHSLADDAQALLRLARRFRIARPTAGAVQAGAVQAGAAPAVFDGGPRRRLVVAAEDRALMRPSEGRASEGRVVALRVIRGGRRD